MTKTKAVSVPLILLKEAWVAGNLSFHPNEQSYWDSWVWGWLLPLPLGNGKSRIESQDKEWGAKFKNCILIPIGWAPVCMRHILVHAYL